MIWRIVLGFAVALVATWSILVVVLVVKRPNPGALREGLRILPDTVGLLRRLMTDPATPRGVRLRIGLVLVYLATPVDLIPDFIPGIGYADDVVIVVAVLRSAVRRAGIAMVEDHWTGTPTGLATLKELARLD